jgi:hypothetical protein
MGGNMNRRLKLTLTIPLLLIIISGLAYAAWTDTIIAQYTLTTAQAPAISVEKGFINLEHGLVKINVRNRDGIIVSTSPDAVIVFVNITNSGATPINTVRMDDTLPYDWYWQPEKVEVQLIQQNKAIIEIGQPYFRASYDAFTRTLTVIVYNIKSATGKYLGMNEKIRIMFKMEYALKRQQLPAGYASNPPTYVNIAAATAWINGWSSSSVTASASFKTEINWVGES